MEFSQIVIGFLMVALIAVSAILIVTWRRGEMSFQVKYDGLVLQYENLKKKYDDLLTHSEELGRLFNQQASAAMTANAALDALKDRTLGLRNNYDSLVRDSTSQQAAMLALGQQMAGMITRIQILESDLSDANNALARLRGEMGRQG